MTVSGFLFSMLGLGLPHKCQGQQVIYPGLICGQKPWASMTVPQLKLFVLALGPHRGLTGILSRNQRCSWRSEVPSTLEKFVEGISTGSPIISLVCRGSRLQTPLQGILHGIFTSFPPTCRGGFRQLLSLGFFSL